MSHAGITKCKECKKVLFQCRCTEKHEIIWEVCKDCQKKAPHTVDLSFNLEELEKCVEKIDVIPEELMLKVDKVYDKTNRLLNAMDNINAVLRQLRSMREDMEHVPEDIEDLIDQANSIIERIKIKVKP